MSAKAIVLVVDDSGWSASSRDAMTVDAVAQEIARLMGAALLVNGYRISDPAVIDWPVPTVTRKVTSIESELDRALARIAELEGQLCDTGGCDCEDCPDCHEATLSPDDHRCPNDECPSHDGGDDGD